MADKFSGVRQVSLDRFDPVEIIEELLKSLNYREKEILQKRHGLNNEEKQTLERIGKDFNITRERVRQIESAGIRKLKTHPSAEEILMPSKSAINQVLEHYGGLMQESHLIDVLIEAINHASPERNPGAVRNDECRMQN